MVSDFTSICPGANLRSCKRTLLRYIIINAMKKQTYTTFFQKVIKLPAEVNINKGFTLLEIIFAITIFAVIIGSIYPAYTSTCSNIQIAENESDIYYMARVAMARIVDDLESAYIPDKNIIDELSDLNSFIGENEYIDGSRADKIRFISRAHIDFKDNSGNRNVAKIAYYAAQVEDTGAITLYRSDTLDSHDWPEEKTEGFVICEGLNSFYLTYTDENGQEYDTWDSSDISFKNKLPHMVAITLEFINKINYERPIQFTTGVFLPMAEKNG
jgi:general secretion pathway protein J